MERMLAKEFKFFDRDESGSIDFDEFNLVLEHLNCKGSARDVDELFDRYDQDCSGAVSYGEFCQILFGKKKGQKPDDGVDPNKTRSVVKMVKDEITGGGERTPQREGPPQEDGQGREQPAGQGRVEERY